MRIPSIYLPIDIELFDDHFKQFLEEFTHLRPDYLSYTLNQIKIGTAKIHYEIEFENLKPSNLSESKKVICQVEAFIVGANRIDIRSAALEINNSGWGEAFLSEFYNMVHEKWGVRLIIPGLEGLEEMPLTAARAKLDDDYGISEISRKYPQLFTRGNDDGNDIVRENNSLPVPEEISIKIERWYKGLEEGLPPIDKINEAPQSAQDHPRGPTLNTIERAKVIKEIKDRHLNWPQFKVADEASTVLGVIINADTVRNCYRAMGWKWERADRVR
jgi:hypothetical protein